MIKTIRLIIIYFSSNVFTIQSTGTSAYVFPAGNSERDYYRTLRFQGRVAGEFKMCNAKVLTS